MTKKRKRIIIACSAVVIAAVTAYSFPGTGEAQRGTPFLHGFLDMHGRAGHAPVVDHVIDRLSERISLSTEQEYSLRETAWNTAEEIERAKEMSSNLRELGILVSTAVRGGIGECRTLLTPDQLAECEALECDLRLRAAHHIREQGADQAGHRVRMLSIVLDLSEIQEQELESLFTRARTNLIEALEEGRRDITLIDHLLLVDEGIRRTLSAEQCAKYEALKSAVHDRLTS